MLANVCSWIARTSPGQNSCPRAVSVHSIPPHATCTHLMAELILISNNSVRLALRRPRFCCSDYSLTQITRIRLWYRLAPTGGSMPTGSLISTS